MELPGVGKHCSHPLCNKLDFLPIKCDVCSNIYCDDHYNYNSHSCPYAYQKNNQVPVCPLCNKPIPVGKGKNADQVVGEHIDSDCQSDPAKNRRKVFLNKCSLKGCKAKEVISLICKECTHNFCLKHRHPQDHRCEGSNGARRKKTYEAALNRTGPTANFTTSIHGNLSEDEALARALALSMQDTTHNNITQEELDLTLAQQLQASETQTTVGGTRTRDRCIVS